MSKLIKSVTIAAALMIASQAGAMEKPAITDQGSVDQINNVIKMLGNTSVKAQDIAKEWIKMPENVRKYMFNKYQIAAGHLSVEKVRSTALEQLSGIIGGEVSEQAQKAEKKLSDQIQEKIDALNGKDAEWATTINPNTKKVFTSAAEFQKAFFQLKIDSVQALSDEHEVEQKKLKLDQEKAEQEQKAAKEKADREEAKQLEKPKADLIKANGDSDVILNSLTKLKIALDSDGGKIFVNDYLKKVVECNGDTDAIKTFFHGNEDVMVAYAKNATLFISMILPVLEAKIKKEKK